MKISTFGDIAVGSRFTSKDSGSREYVKVVPYATLGLDIVLDPADYIVTAWDYSGIHYHFEDDDIVGVV